MNFDAVIFDFDGIVVDSEPLHHLAFQRVFEPLGFGFSWEAYLDQYVGFDDRDAIRERFRQAERLLEEATMRELMSAKARAFIDIVKEGGVKPYPGVVPLIRKISGVHPLAICSGALKGDIDPILEILGLQKAFDLMVTADQVSTSKPDPESYHKAVSLLQQKFAAKSIRPEACLAIEDTPAGIAAATGAGLKVLAVTNTYPASELAGAHYVVDTLADTYVETLLGLA